jgi:hypothetical protein
MGDREIGASIAVALVADGIRKDSTLRSSFG